MSDGRTASNSALSQDIHTLGNWLGVIIQEQNGMAAYDLVEEIRAMSKARRDGDAAAAFQLADRLENLPLESKHVLIKAFSNYFQLINIAEDLQRIRVIRQREARGTLRESIVNAVSALHGSGKTANEIRSLLENYAPAPGAYRASFRSQAPGNLDQTAPYCRDDGNARPPRPAAARVA